MKRITEEIPVHVLTSIKHSISDVEGNLWNLLELSYILWVAACWRKTWKVCDVPTQQSLGVTFPVNHVRRPQVYMCVRMYTPGQKSSQTAGEGENTHADGESRYLCLLTPDALQRMLLANAFLITSSEGLLKGMFWVQDKLKGHHLWLNGNNFD